MLLLGIWMPVYATEEAGEFPALEDIPVAEGYDDPMYWRETHREAYAKAAGEPGLTAETKLAGFGDFLPRAVQRGEILRQGIDVSVYQDNIDWKAVADSGVEFAIIRVAVRGWGASGTLMKDSMFQQNIEGAQANGIQVGAYIFSQATTQEEGREEARFLMNLLSGYKLELPLVIDYEYAWVNGANGGRLYNANLSKDEATAVCNAFCDEVEQYGYEGMVYANYSMLNNHLNAGELCRVWLAHYTKETWYEGDYEYWQCGSNGSIPGIEGDVDLNFWFDPNTSGDLPFRDVQKDDWFYEEVKRAYELGIVNGDTPRTFCPNDLSSRCQVVTMLYRMMGSPAVSGSTTFLDVEEDGYYRNAVLWAQKNGLVQGYSQEWFGTNDPITREDLAVLVYRHAGSPGGGSSLSGFSDAGAVSDYAVAALKWAVGKGLVRGYEDGTLRPQDATTRAEACALMMRYRNM